MAHPEQNGFVAPYTLDERLKHIQIAKKELQTEIPWLCDSMDNKLKHALGNAPNSEFVINPEGEIVVARSWSAPDELRKDLARLVGPSNSVTTVADLGLPALSPPKTAATGVVPRIELPGAMTPIRVKPVDDTTLGDGPTFSISDNSEHPHYVKLRAEADRSLLESGKGQLYLGFFLDPIYKVHWNNRAAPITFEIAPGASSVASPSTGQGPEVEEDIDADPREFLVELDGKTGETLRLKITYFACDDAETFCVPVTQHYELTLERDGDGGSRRTPGRRRPSRGRRNQGNNNATPTPQMMERMLRRLPVFRELDRNGDGELSPEEIELAPKALLELDLNNDGQISIPEMRPNRGNSTRGGQRRLDR